MPIKPYEYPDEGELVVVKIKNVNPNSADAELVEYPGKIGMIHISEVARKWVKDIRNFVKPGQMSVALVMEVDKKRDFISLSLKRVNRREFDKKMQEFRREEKAEKMLELFAKELGITLEEAYKRVGFKLQEKFGEMFKGFLTALENPSILVKKGFNKEDVELLKKVAEKSIEIRERPFKLMLTVRSYEKDGLERVKKFLESIEKKFKVEIKYYAAPQYLLTFGDKDPKKGEKRLNEIIEFGKKESKKFGCEFSAERVE